MVLHLAAPTAGHATRRAEGLIGANDIGDEEATRVRQIIVLVQNEDVPDR